MPHELVLTILVIVAGCYMAWNIGANDVANAMGTSVGSKALTMRQAVYIAAFLEFGGAFFFGSQVSETVQNGIVDVSLFSQQPILLVYGMLASLIAAGLWLQIASYYGWPVSTTHTIVGSIVGFGLVFGGVEAVHWDNVSFIVSSWIISPLCGAAIAFMIFTLLRRVIFHSSQPLQVTKKIAPLLLFAVFTVFTLVLLLSGLHNMQLSLTFWPALAISSLVGIISAMIGSFFVRNIDVGHTQTELQHVDTAALPEIEKAREHLIHAYEGTSGEMEHQMAVILEDMDSFKRIIHKKQATDHIAAEYNAVERIFGYLQITSACLMAFSHGANDVANAIGPLSAALMVLKTGQISDHATISLWTLALGGVGIVVGLASWGWRVIETIGKKITELTPTRGFAAEFGAALTILVASRLGMPISTTHTLVGAVLGVGLARGIDALNLSMTRDIFISWVVTVPSGAAITVLFFYFFQFIFG